MFKKTGSFYHYGLSLYCGRFGSGAFIGMVDYLNRMHKKYPDALIVTNFEYKYATHVIRCCRDFFEITNGEKGVIFAIDKIHSLYSMPDWEELSDVLFEFLCQQKKLHIKVVATAGLYFHVSKKLRVLCHTVVFCRVFFNRIMFTDEYDAFDFEFKKDTDIFPLKMRLNLIPAPKSL